MRIVDYVRNLGYLHRTFDLEISIRFKRLIDFISHVALDFGKIEDILL